MRRSLDCKLAALRVPPHQLATRGRSVTLWQVKWGWSIPARVWRQGERFRTTFLLEFWSWRERPALIWMGSECITLGRVLVGER